MSYNRRQFRGFIQDTLDEYAPTFGPGFASEGAVALLLGTAAQESAFGTFLRQRGGGPALGPYQMEFPTWHWLTGKWDEKISFAGWSFEELEWNLKRATLMARLLYRAYPEPIPAPGDIEGLAALWKLRWNTPLGMGTTAQFIDNFRRYVSGI